MKQYALIIIVSLISLTAVHGQNDLLEIADSAVPEETGFVEQTFKGTRLINGHSIETRPRGVLDVLISHRFGRLNTGGYQFFGLDESNVRLGVDYGVTDVLNVGFARNSFEKTFDGFIKYKLLRQHTDKMPVSALAFASGALTTLKTGDPDGEPDFNSRLTFSYQVIIARKFTPALSLQISPTLVHRNTVREPGEPNDIVALGGGGRIKLTQRLSLNAEYYHMLNAPSGAVMKNSVAVGFDIETGGHVFQLHFTNSRAMNEKGFITETTDDFFEGDIRFGFNISRTFQLR